MDQMIFVNLPVTDLSRARAFYAAVGFSFDERFFNEKAACVTVSDRISIMILTRDFFATFTSRPVGDPAGAVSAMTALSRDSREAVDAFMAAGLAAGGTDNDRLQEMGDAMYGRSISDPDGNVIEVMWMDMAKMAPTLPAEMDAAVDA